MIRNGRQDLIPAWRRSRCVVLAWPGSAPGAQTAEEAQHPDDHGRRHRLVESSASTARGMVGFETPNIDRIAKEGMVFTTCYGRAKLHGRPRRLHHRPGGIRTGLTEGRHARRPVGLQKEDITIAEALKPLGYATGQFGKNHLGDRDEILPTAHGFDEFFGNLYHLNAEEEPECPDYPKNDAAFGRGSDRAACSTPTPTARSRTRAPSTASAWKRSTRRFATPPSSSSTAGQGREALLLWMNSTRMHVFTHVRDRMRGRAACRATSTPTA